MKAISIPQYNFQLILTILKYLSIHPEIKMIDEKYYIKGVNIRNFLLKQAIMPIELKNDLLKNFLSILASFDKAILIYETEIDTIILTKNQICNLIKPVISRAAHPADNTKLSRFFNHFDCQTKEKELFIEIL